MTNDTPIDSATDDAPELTSGETYSIAKVAIIVTYVLQVVGVFVYFIFGHFGAHYQTPFTGSIVVMLVYWILTLVLQLLFMMKALFTHDDISVDNQKTAVSIVEPHFSINNLLTYLWCYYFAQEKFVRAEFILIVNFANLLALYFTQRTVSLQNLTDFMTIHVPVTAMPLAWTLYAIFWNGACMFHSHYKALQPRLLANLFMLTFVVVPNFFLAVFRDWAVPLATSVLMLGLGLRQIVLKTIGAQWILAFGAALIDFVLAVTVISADILNRGVDDLATAAAIEDALADPEAHPQIPTEQEPLLP